MDFLQRFKGKTETLTKKGLADLVQSSKVPVDKGSTTYDFINQNEPGPQNEPVYSSPLTLPSVQNSFQAYPPYIYQNTPPSLWAPSIPIYHPSNLLNRSMVTYGDAPLPIWGNSPVAGNMYNRTLENQSRLPGVYPISRPINPYIYDGYMPPRTGYAQPLRTQSTPRSYPYSQQFHGKISPAKPLNNSISRSVEQPVMEKRVSRPTSRVTTNIVVPQNKPKMRDSKMPRQISFSSHNESQDNLDQPVSRRGFSMQADAASFKDKPRISSKQEAKREPNIEKLVEAKVVKFLETLTKQSKIGNIKSLMRKESEDNEENQRLNLSESENAKNSRTSLEEGGRKNPKIFKEKVETHPKRRLITVTDFKPILQPKPLKKNGPIYLRENNTTSTSYQRDFGIRGDNEVEIELNGHSYFQRLNTEEPKEPRELIDDSNQRRKTHISGRVADNGPRYLKAPS